MTEVVPKLELEIEKILIKVKLLEKFGSRAEEVADAIRLIADKQADEEAIKNILIDFELVEVANIEELRKQAGPVTDDEVAMEQPRGAAQAAGRQLGRPQLGAWAQQWGDIRPRRTAIDLADAMDDHDE